MIRAARSTGRLANAIRKIARPVSGIVRHATASNIACSSQVLNATASTRFPSIAPGRGLSTEAQSSEKHEFQAETAKLLDIVTHSLYTDKEVFIRELVSNSSDALEKRRYEETVSGSPSGESMVVRITCDTENGILQIQDTGVGMSRDDLVSNLGTIAKSGTRSFVEQLQDSGAGTSGSLIGAFGVGFYSSFMVADTVTVKSRRHDHAEAHRWSSTGTGSYTIDALEGDSPIGTTIELHLKPECKQFSDPAVIKEIIHKYSNFVSFPIYVDGDRQNTVDALWTKSKSEVTDEQHNAFFKFVSGTQQEPRYKLMFASDAPMDIKCALYLPSYRTELPGMVVTDSSVHLYSKKVLIQHRCDHVLPHWLHFVTGVVDCADIPLNVSREHMQDSALMTRLREVLTTRIIKWLNDEAKKDPKSFLEFQSQYGTDIRRGLLTDLSKKEKIATLLRFDSSENEDSANGVSFDEYVGRMKEGQEKILVLVAPSRAMAEASPYAEAWKAKGHEIIYSYNAVDDMVFQALGTFKGKQIVKIAHEAAPDSAPQDGALATADSALLCAWLKDYLSESAGNVSKVETTTRLVDSPAVIVGHDSEAMRQIKAIMMAQGQSTSQLPQEQVELHINPSHPTIVGLHSMKDSDPNRAQAIAELLLQSSMLAAGHVDDGSKLLKACRNVMQAAVTK